MFKTSAICPTHNSSVLCPAPSNLKANVITCCGVRENGTLKYACSICASYKQYVKDKYPDN